MINNNNKTQRLVKLITDNTPLYKFTALNELIQTESDIRYKATYHGRAKFKDDYFYLATAKVIDKYKNPIINKHYLV